MKDNVTMLFTASLTVTQKHELMTTLQQTVQDGAIESTSVSPNVDVRLLSGSMLWDVKFHSQCYACFSLGARIAEDKLNIQWLNLLQHCRIS